MRISLIKFKQSHALFVASLIALLIAIVSCFSILFPANTNSHVTPTPRAELDKKITPAKGLFYRPSTPNQLDEEMPLTDQSNEVAHR